MCKYGFLLLISFLSTKIFHHIVIFLIVAVFITALSRQYIRLLIIWLYSVFFVHYQYNIYYVPIILDRRLVYIPAKRRRSKFHTISELTELDKRAILFLNHFECKIDKHLQIRVFNLIDNEEKSILMSEI